MPVSKCYHVGPPAHAAATSPHQCDPRPAGLATGPGVPTRIPRKGSAAGAIAPAARASVAVPRSSFRTLIRLARRRLRASDIRKKMVIAAGCLDGCSRVLGRARAVLLLGGASECRQASSAKMGRKWAKAMNASPWSFCPTECNAGFSSAKTHSFFVDRVDPLRRAKPRAGEMPCQIA